MSDNTQTMPDSGTPKKHYVTELREQVAAKDSEIAALRAQIEERDGTVAATPARPALAYDPSTDPYAGIRSLKAVYCVTTSVRLPAHTEVMPHLPREKASLLLHDLKPYAQRTWSNCPFSFTVASKEDTANLEVQYAKFWHFRVDRSVAERVFRSEYNPMPEEAIILPSEFTGFDYQEQPEGVRRPCSKDALTELIRYYSQALAGTFWLDYAYHPEIVTFTSPNPYGVGRERFRMDPALIRKATKEGGIDGSWGVKL